MSKKRDGPSLDTAVFDIYRREIGHLSNRKFAIRLAASEDIVLRLGLLRKLDRHRGCVNTVGFNDSGDILVSGSDDRKVILWDWEMGSVKLSFHSGHINNIFQAKIMPGTDDRSIVTCAADGQVRHALIPENGEVEPKLLGKHRRRAHKLANEPGSPHIFYTCGEDGLVQHFDLRTGVGTQLFTCKSLPGRNYSMHVVNLNSIAIDPRNPNLFVIGGSDEFTRLYDIRRYKWDGSNNFGQPADYFCPKRIIGDENLGITGLAYSDQSELLVSYCDEFIYLFSKDMGLGNDVNLILDNDSCSSNSETEIDDKTRVYKGHINSMTVKGVNFFGPKCEYIVSGSDCGRMFIWRKSDSELIRVLEADKQVVNCIESHPYDAMLASSGLEHDIKIWTPSEIDKATLPTDIHKVFARRFLLLPNVDVGSGDEYYSNGFDDDNEDSSIDSEDEDYQDEDDNDDYYDDEDAENYNDDDDDDDDDDGGGGGGGVGDEEVDGDVMMEVDGEVVTEVDDFTCDAHEDPNENDIQVFNSASNDEYGDSLEDFPDDEE